MGYECDSYSFKTYFVERDLQAVKKTFVNYICMKSGTDSTKINRPGHNIRMY